MAGGAGHDRYTVDNAGDAVIELDSQGFDEVRTALSSYTLGDHVESLTGTSSSGQTLTGNALSNIITGGTGADTMTGGAGNDIYTVDNAGDTVVELDGGGIDECARRSPSTRSATTRDSLWLLGFGSDPHRQRAGQSHRRLQRCRHAERRRRRRHAEWRREAPT